MLTLPRRRRTGAQRTSAQKQRSRAKALVQQSQGESLPLTHQGLTLQDHQPPDCLYRTKGLHHTKPLLQEREARDLPLLV